MLTGVGLASEARIEVGRHQDAVALLPEHELADRVADRSSELGVLVTFDPTEGARVFEALRRPDRPAEAEVEHGLPERATIGPEQSVGGLLHFAIGQSPHPGQGRGGGRRLRAEGGEAGCHLGRRRKGGLRAGDEWSSPPPPGRRSEPPRPDRCRRLDHPPARRRRSRRPRSCRPAGRPAPGRAPDHRRTRRARRGRRGSRRRLPTAAGRRARRRGRARRPDRRGQRAARAPSRSAPRRRPTPGAPVGRHRRAPEPGSRRRGPRPPEPPRPRPPWGSPPGTAPPWPTGRHRPPHPPVSPDCSHPD